MDEWRTPPKSADQKQGPRKIRERFPLRITLQPGACGLPRDRRARSRMTPSRTSLPMLRGDIRWFRFASPDKRRPVLILGNARALPSLSQVPVVPLSSQGRELQWEVALNEEDGVPTACVLKPEWIRSVDRAHIGPLLAHLPEARWREVRAAVVGWRGRVAAGLKRQRPPLPPTATANHLVVNRASPLFAGCTARTRAGGSSRCRSLPLLWG